LENMAHFICRTIDPMISLVFINIEQHDMHIHMHTDASTLSESPSGKICENFDF